MRCDDLGGWHLPTPLNADLFTQLQKIARSKHKQAIVHLIGDIVELFGPSFRLALARAAFAGALSNKCIVRQHESIEEYAQSLG